MSWKARAMLAAVLVSLLNEVVGESVDWRQLRAKRSSQWQVNHNPDTCTDSYKVQENKIIRTKDSQNAGAIYLQSPHVISRGGCLQACCNVLPCNLAVYEERNTSSCWLFDCGKPSVCVFTPHADFTILSTHHHHKHNPDQRLYATSTTLRNTSTDPPPGTTTPFARTSRPADKHSQIQEACSKFQWKCDSGSIHCIGIYDVCDGIPNCSDGSDEEGCFPEEEYATGEGSSSAALHKAVVEQHMAAQPSHKQAEQQLQGIGLQRTPEVSQPAHLRAELSTLNTGEFTRQKGPQQLTAGSEPRQHSPSAADWKNSGQQSARTEDILPQRHAAAAPQRIMQKQQMPEGISQQQPPENVQAMSNQQQASPPNQPTWPEKPILNNNQQYGSLSSASQARMSPAASIQQQQNMQQRPQLAQLPSPAAAQQPFQYSPYNQPNYQQFPGSYIDVADPYRNLPANAYPYADWTDLMNQQPDDYSAAVSASFFDGRQPQSDHKEMSMDKVHSHGSDTAGGNDRSNADGNGNFDLLKPGGLHENDDELVGHRPTTDLSLLMKTKSKAAAVTTTPTTRATTRKSIATAVAELKAIHVGDGAVAYVEAVGETRSRASAIIALLLGMLVLLAMLGYLACHIRKCKRGGSKRGKALKVGDEDYLINGLYL